MTQNCCSECASALEGEDTDPAAVVDTPRWTPDEQLVPAILAGAPKRMRDLGENDRSWAVAGLGLAGLTAEDIASRLKCSLRLVRAIRALPLTAACVYAQTETANWINENRLKASAIRSLGHDLTAMTTDRDRLREKLSRLMDAHIVGTPSCRRCGTPWDKGNTYFEGGSRRCRNCNRIKQQAFRDRRREQEVVTDNRGTIGDPLRDPHRVLVSRQPYGEMISSDPVIGAAQDIHTTMAHLHDAIINVGDPLTINQNGG